MANRIKRTPASPGASGRGLQLGYDPQALGSEETWLRR